MVPEEQTDKGAKRRKDTTDSSKSHSLTRLINRLLQCSLYAKRKKRIKLKSH